MTSLALFDDICVNVPKTEGIKYAGSKQKLLSHILSLAQKVKPRTILDGFAGTTRVSQAFAQSGYQVIANDVSVWSEIFGNCYLKNHFPASHFAPLIEHLNQLKPIDGWFTENYGGETSGPTSIGMDGLKKPWQKHNTRKLDAIRTEIDRLTISSMEKSVLLTSLIYALDEVDSTLGHFSSYLSDWSPRSYKTMHLRVPRLIPRCAEHQMHRRDIFELLPHIEVDLAYLDPPYGSNNEKMPASRVRYAAYYHIWTTICLNDKPPLFGKAKRRLDTSDTVAASVFEDFRRNEQGQLIAVNAIQQTLKAVNAKHIILSYSSGGRATANELNDAISDVGELMDVVEIDYRRNVMAGMRWTHQWVREAESPNKEFLFLVRKSVL